MRTLERRLQQDQKSDSKFSREQMPWGQGPGDSLFQGYGQTDPGGQVSLRTQGVKVNGILLQVCRGAEVRDQEVCARF